MKRVYLAALSLLVLGCHYPPPPPIDIDSTLALCGAGISFSDEIEAKLRLELKKSAPEGALSAGFKRAAKTAVELEDAQRYALYLGCICQQTRITQCDKSAPSGSP